jgi:pimeloyl-ACP methyl ester carboxylesterase
MNDPIHHLPGIEALQIRTARLQSHVLVAGPDTGEPVIFLHGNLSAATFWEETTRSYRTSQSPTLGNRASSDFVLIGRATRHFPHSRR